jgi:rod shape-determining protein MreC
MYGFQHFSNLETGQSVYTTGIGGTFPAGLFIGTVVRPEDNNREIYASMNVKPAVDFSRVQEVFILAGSERSDIWDDGDGVGQFLRPEIQ